MTTKPPAKDIADELASAGVGTWAGTSSWGIYVGNEPKEPNEVITCYDTGGLSADPKWRLDYSSVQVRIRGAVNGYDTAYAKALAVKNALLGLPRKTINNTVHVGVIMIGDIVFVANDDNNRPIFTTNWRVFREPDNGTYRSALS